MSIELISFCDECDGTIVGDNRSRTFCGECYDPLVKERNKLADELAEAKSEIAWLEVEVNKAERKIEELEEIIGD